MRGSIGCLLALVLFAAAPAAFADDWLPHPDDATWTYEWSDTAYNPVPTREKVTVDKKKPNGSTFTLDWTTDGLAGAGRSAATRAST
jgi:hypothetical protein